MPASETLNADSKLTIVLLSLGVILSLLGGLPEAVFRACGRYAFGTTAATTVRLAEWGGGMIALITVGSFPAVAFGMLLARFIGTLALAVLAKRSTAVFEWGTRHADRHEVRALIMPAAYFMAFPLSNALSLQGVTLVVAGVLGPAAAATFNTYRTLARVTVQATGAFSHALWPEFSRMFGDGNLSAVSKLYRKGQWIGIALAAATGALAYFASPFVLEYWSHGRIPFDSSLMLLTMAYAAAAGAWHVPRILMLATNQHGALALHSLWVSALTLPSALVLVRLSGLEGAVVAMLVGEILLFLLSARGVSQLLRPATRPDKAMA